LHWFELKHVTFHHENNQNVTENQLNSMECSEMRMLELQSSAAAHRRRVVSGAAAVVENFSSSGSKPMGVVNLSSLVAAPTPSARPTGNVIYSYLCSRLV
jgi:hypothetical protein